MATLAELTAARRKNMRLTRAQFGELLIRKGLKAAVETAIAAIPDETERAVAQEWYAHTPDVVRTHPRVEALRAALGISDSQADAWFAEAKLY